MGLPQMKFKANLNFITMHCEFFFWVETGGFLFYGLLTMFGMGRYVFDNNDDHRFGYNISL